MVRPLINMICILVRQMRLTLHLIEYVRYCRYNRIMKMYELLVTKEVGIEGIFARLTTQE